MSLNGKVIKEILNKADEASLLGFEDKTKITVKEADISNEEKKSLSRLARCRGIH